ncbi:hypothetical protein ACHAW5_007923 [Stephanodiscus triporus]|uniref:1-alkyl-2-acetylglycerophosphocholine esterase n=1 Tax=Stephanodiscus triporus TaxID=2934178 RepID=A0ABD3MWF1_9STRA
MSRASSAIVLLFILGHAVCCSAFSRPSISSSTAARRHRGKDATKHLPNILLTNDNNPRDPSLSQSNPNDENSDCAGDAAIGGDLATALARLDEEWKLANSRDGGKRIGDWTVLDASDDIGGDGEIVYLLEPASGAAPSCIIFFLGGAVLGQFPHISYSAFCKKLASRMNASVVAVPYEVGLDHFGIAQRAVKRMKNAVIACEDSRGYPSGLPKYAIGHSLGAKLHSIGIAATGIGEELSGVGFVSYNNFGFAETITMARSFVKEMRVGAGAGIGMGSSSTPFDALFDLAGMAVSAVGLEFTPSPNDMDKILKNKFDEEVLKKIRMFCFDDDDLDSTKRFLHCFEGCGIRPSVSYLPGTHLTPVFLRLGLDDLPDDARDMANQVTGGFQNASFGNEDTLDALVNEVSDWMLGRGPHDSRPAPKQIAGIIDAEIER